MRAAWMLGVVALVACATRVAGPPEVHWGVDECSRCHMIVSEPRYAGVARGPAGEEERFDDLGCLTAFLAERGSDSWQAWVRDAPKDEWVSAKSAWYARDMATHSPMGSGYLAYASREAAANAAGGTPPLTWIELLASRASRPPVSSRLDESGPPPLAIATRVAASPDEPSTL